MTNIRRYPLQNKPVFITAVCYHRITFLQAGSMKQLLIDVIHEVRGEKPFKFYAYVVLDEHVHWVMRIGNETKHSMSSIVQSIKLRFTHRYKKLAGVDGNTTLWQHRFWDHIIRDAKGFHRHLDYIHFNPVKHGYVIRPEDYPWSSLKRYIENGKYAPGWAAMRAPESISGMNPE